MEKICFKCGISKDIQLFSKSSRNKNGLHSSCKACNKIYYEQHKDKILKGFKLYSQLNKDDIIEYKKKYYKENKGKVNSYRNEWEKYKISIDPLFKLTKNIRCSIRNSTKVKGGKNKSTTRTILGCSFEEFKKYIESKFEYWMTWANHGKYNGTFEHGWDLDHIIPISFAITREDIIRLNHYTNFQPLCSKVNRDIKSNKLIYAKIKKTF